MEMVFHGKGMGSPRCHEDEARGDVVSEVQGLRSDLRDRIDERLQRIENDVVDIKARIRP